MTAPRVLILVAVAGLVAGLLLVLVWDGSPSWFAYAPLSDDPLSFTGGRFLSDEEMVGWALVAVSAVIGAGVAGYRIGRRHGHG